jgi:D-alanyl-lipoteichoic acid acyltransferase DltB (MBOAT superfamily)
MAIGIALLFGLLLPENFRRPYVATDMRDFWRRWHISLSKFMRDYLYIPLGGSRNGPARFVWAAIATMGICGLWHGAGWTYVVWGLWHGAGLVICHGWQKLERPLPAVAGWFITMLFVLVGWVVFRASSFSVAASVLQSMAGGAGFSGVLQQPGLMLASAAVSVLLPSAHEIINRRPILHRSVAIGFAVLAGLCVLEVGRGIPTNFIYFRF